MVKEGSNIMMSNEYEMSTMYYWWQRDNVPRVYEKGMPSEYRGKDYPTKMYRQYEQIMLDVHRLTIAYIVSYENHYDLLYAQGRIIKYDE